MKLYRYELGSDCGDEEIIAGKQLIGEFFSDNKAFDYLRSMYSPTISIEFQIPIEQYQVFTIGTENYDESLDEVLFLIQAS